MHHVKALYFIVGLALSTSANAACPGATVSIAEQSGGASLHVTVVDQLCNPIAPAGVTWSGQGALSVVADATGFNFTAPPGTGAITITATAKHTASGVTAPLQDVVTMPAVTALSFTSP